MPLSRRRFLRQGTALLASPALAGLPEALGNTSAGNGYRNLLVLVELKGGNDGFNTLVPYADPAYYALRPRIAIARDAIVPLTDRVGLHPALAPLARLWDARELAVLQGVGYPDPNLSHFRSIEIWETASRSDEYLHEGWLARTFAIRPVPASFAADGVVVGSGELGPLAGASTRAIALADTEQFLRRARLAGPSGRTRNKALAHILRTEADITQAAAHLDGGRAFRTAFPAGAFGKSVETAMQVVANRAGIAVVRVTLGGFDTHGGQPATHARLLGELAAGLAAIKDALEELGRWNEALVLTYAEFGRRPRENQSSGTDHGTASVHFALGGRVKGGLFGAPPDLSRLDGAGNVEHSLDFRSVYATVLERWWGIDSRDPLGGRFVPVPYLST